ncbi:phosphatidylinositol kinase- protein kinase tor1 [Gryganskiella cystojenkinii]|nr:phosphatidylinositol kinase- protein kinase tor1 [Gryganskiella cystojenkinii]
MTKHEISVPRHSKNMELSWQDQAKFYDEITNILRILVQSADSDDKLCGVLIIDNLIGIEDDNTALDTRFANFLRQLLPSDVPTMTVAAKALGKLAQQGGTFTTEFVEFEVKRAIERLAGDRQEARRHASVLVLAELARHASVIVYAYVGTILDNIWGTFREQKQIIREAAADTLSALLVLIADRESAQKAAWYSRIEEEAQRGLRIGTVESIHGSLLIIKELLLHGGMFMNERFMNTCHIVLQLKDHRDPLVRRTIINLIPELAAYNPTAFINFYLRRSLMHLIGQLHLDKERKVINETDRAMVFVAIGRIALVVQHDIDPFLNEIMQCIKDGLRIKSKTRATADVPIFNCISMLAKAVGPTLSPHMSELLDLMLMTGLSEEMCRSLAVLSVQIPDLLAGVQERLLIIISIILSGQLYKEPGAPQPKKLPAPVLGDRDTDTLILALKTLGSFNFNGHVLNEFVRDCCLVYLDHNNAGVRRAAALTSCRLFARDPIVFQTSAHAVQVVGEVLDRLLLVVTSDPDATIRQAILASLDERFDRHLAKAEHVRSLFFALNDEVFVIREMTISIIGRITAHNPAYVIPPLRKLLIQLLTEIEYSGMGRNKEESTQLLTLLIVASEPMIKPYIDRIVRVLLPNIKDSSPGVVSSVLQAFGELAQVGGETMLPYMDQLMPNFIEILQDQSSSMKRSAALTALGRLASNTGYVIDPYLKYPILLDILVSILKTEQSVRIRQETMKLVGVLGALDPYRHKQMVIESGDPNQKDKSNNTDVTLLMNGVDPTSDEYYPTVVITALLKILKDPSLSQQYQPATQAILNIFQALRLKMLPFLPQIMPVYVNIMQSGTVLNLDFYFENMSFLVSIVKEHIRPYIPELLQLVQDNWSHTRVQERIIGLIESIALCLDGEYKSYMPKFLRSMMAILEADLSSERQQQHHHHHHHHQQSSKSQHQHNHHHGNASFRVLQALVKLGSNIEEYMHMIIPLLVKTFERPEAPLNLRRAAISTVGALSRRVDLSDHASRITHALSRILALQIPELRTATMDVLCLMAIQLGQNYLNFAPLVRKVLTRENIVHGNYELVMTKLINKEPLPSPYELTGTGDDRYVLTTDVPQAESDSRKLPVNPMALRRAWDTQSRSTEDDWMDWIRRLRLELLKGTPSHSLRACAELANSFQPLARELFNAAFMSCWTSLTEQFQAEFAEALRTAIMAPHVSPEIIQTILNVAEYMEHDDKPLPIEIRTLGKYAHTCHAYAKALHYKELEFMKVDRSRETIESLITINDDLQQPDAAAGILTYAQRHHSIELQESWYERLQRWEDALAAYERRQIEHPDDLTVTLGRMRCLHALGEWEALSGLGQEKWGHASAKFRGKMASHVAAAAWGLGQWDQLSEYISVMKDHSSDKAFFRAILYLRREQFDQAKECIEETRSSLDTELTALVSESYSRAYATVVRVQMTAELEEVIAYKRYEQGNQPERQATIRRTWMKRLSGCERNVEIWQKSIKVHALALTPAEDMVMRIKFMNLCRKSGRLPVAEQAMVALMGPETVNMNFTDMVRVTPPQVIYAKLKYMWATGVRAQTLACLHEFTDRLATDLRNGSASAIAAGNHETTTLTGLLKGGGSEDDYAQLLARCYLKQGEWQFAVQQDWTPDSVEHILTHYQYATRLDKNWYKAWHTWALANFEVISYYERNASVGTSDQVVKHVFPSIEGFFKSIALSSGNSLQDTLRLLTLWFKFGHRSDVSATLGQGFPTVSIDTWLQVIPQLIARIHAPSQNVHRLIHKLLVDVGQAHPQALVYSLAVASKSPSVFRKNAAVAIIENMMVHSPTLVNQALLVSNELVRVAILWHEMWEEGLQDLLNLNAQGNRNIEAMFAILDPLHRMIMKRPETMSEVVFVKTFGRELKEAFDCCARYRQSRDANELSNAWGIYMHVFEKIRKIPPIESLDLPYVSPQLQGARDIELAIPGTYKSGEPVVHITSFVPTLPVLSSKQHPRRLSIMGSDGREHEFLLKGHEDLRQDERVMQLFGLVNTLLAADPETFKRHLAIQQYSVTPLSPNSGLIGWVKHTDTLHDLIKGYRDSRGLSLKTEHQFLIQRAPSPERGFDLLTVMQKVEIYEYMFSKTSGDDLYKILWLKSKNSEVWLERRTTYTRSLAVMSMVGHILGLGDRHPSNIMMDRNSGRIVHIDFGDCFEVAMHRAQFPERIPFRLTRMLVLAMEASGYEGSFRKTSESVMRVLRENKESVMAVLEAFVHDPLINWRIFHTSPEEPTQQQQQQVGKGKAKAGTGGAGDQQKVAATAVTNGGPDQEGPSLARSLRRPVLPSELDLIEKEKNQKLKKTATHNNNNGNHTATTNGHRHNQQTQAGAATNNATAKQQGEDSSYGDALSSSDSQQNPAEPLNQRAITVLNRVTNKLTGRDFSPESLDVESQVEKLIRQATSTENLCQCWVGYCAFW